MNNLTTHFANEGEQKAETESPIFKSLETIDELVTQLVGTTNNLQTRLSAVLIAEEPKTENAPKEDKETHSTIEMRLYQIQMGIEGNIISQKQLINRLQI